MGGVIINGVYLGSNLNSNLFWINFGILVCFFLGVLDYHCTFAFKHVCYAVLACHLAVSLFDQFSQVCNLLAHSP